MKHKQHLDELRETLYRFFVFSDFLCFFFLSPKVMRIITPVFKFSLTIIGFSDYVPTRARTLYVQFGYNSIVLSQSDSFATEVAIVLQRG